MIRAIIIDDNSKAVDYIRSLLNDHFPQIELTGTASTVANALKVFKEMKPDLIFLDIEIGNQTGFDFLKKIKPVDTRIIFTTGHDEYALEAFKYNAVHYLVKPFDLIQLREAIDRVLESKKSSTMLSNIEQVIAHIDRNKRKKLAIPTEEGIKYIQPSDILYIQADGSYSRITLSDKSSILVSKLLREFEEVLPASEFYRISKSYLINFHFVKMFRRQEGGIIEMEDGKQISVPRRKRDDFLFKMTGFTH